MLSCKTPGPVGLRRILKTVWSWRVPRYSKKCQIWKSGKCLLKISKSINKAMCWISNSFGMSNVFSPVGEVAINWKLSWNRIVQYAEHSACLALFVFGWSRCVHRNEELSPLGFPQGRALTLDQKLGNIPPSSHLSHLPPHYYHQTDEAEVQRSVTGVGHRDW